MSSCPKNVAVGRFHGLEFIILFVVSFARLREVFFACKCFEENFAGRGDLTSFNSPF